MWERSSVKTLDLGSNEFGDEGVMAFSKVIANENSAVETLNLSYCGMTCVGAIALAEALAKNKTVTDLRINGNRIGTQTTTQLCQCCEKQFLHHPPWCIVMQTGFVLRFTSSQSLGIVRMFSPTPSFVGLSSPEATCSSFLLSSFFAPCSLRAFSKSIFSLVYSMTLRVAISRAIVRLSVLHAEKSEEFMETIWSMFKSEVIEWAGYPSTPMPFGIARKDATLYTNTLAGAHYFG